MTAVLFYHLLAYPWRKIDQYTSHASFFEWYRYDVWIGFTEPFP